MANSHPTPVASGLATRTLPDFLTATFGRGFRVADRADAMWPGATIPIANFLAAVRDDAHFSANLQPTARP